MRVLQKQWMQDDFSTLTNAYPDHEDIMGPAGINIPEVMTEFIPLNGQLITSEEQMLPILTEGAQRFGTSIKGVGWLEAGLLTPDILSRFPYEEHPYNLALLIGLARELGVERDFLLKEIADRVIPDLGNLKVYPIAPYQTRRLQFSNGMSANERLGCVGNWIRLGFDTHDYQADPGAWLTTVVNNRADRIPRSRVFASVLVEDLSADRHFLIGGNLNGLMGYIKEAWAQYIDHVSLWPRGNEATVAEARQHLQTMARKFRLPMSDDLIRARLAVMVTAVLSTGERIEDAATEQTLQLPSEQARLLELWMQPEQLGAELKKLGIADKHVTSLTRHLSADLQTLKEYTMLVEKVTISQPAQRAEVDAQFKDAAWQWFSRKLYVVQDYFAPGNKIVDTIANETPPGFFNRVMGIQNIKGTGLDFVYRWQAWDKCYQLCQKALRDNKAELEEGLRGLANFQEYGLLCEEYVQETIEEVRHRSAAQRDEMQTAIQIINSNLRITIQHVREKIAVNTQSTGWLTRLFSILEGLFDGFDAIKRRTIADQIYKDLVDERISHERAAIELNALNKRQKGGWFLGMIQEGMQLFRSDK